MNPYDHRIFVLLETIPARAIKTWIKLHGNIIDYTAEHYSYFAHKRSQVMEELKQALLANTICYEFNDWIRIVSQQFSNTPLSTIGSVKHFPGGRFNIGVIDIERFPQFPALYLAEDSATAFLEMSGLKKDTEIDGLTAKEIFIGGNFSHFILKGKLTNILDLTNPKSLKEFYTHLKGIQLPMYYTKQAAKLKIPAMLPVQSLEMLRKTIFIEDWRLMPMQFDVPANSQILGQIASSAGIEAILYPSVKNNKSLLAIYPQNFANSEAYIEILGSVAETVTHVRIDKDTYKNFLP